MSSGGDKLFAALLAVPRAVRAAFAGRRFRRELAGVPRYALDELPEGMRGRVTGVARPFGAVLEAPLSGRICVYYCIAIEELRRGVVNELANEQDAVRFVLEDRGHRAVIDPAHATVSVAFDHASTSRAAFDADAAQRSLLERHALVVRDWFWTDSLRYREAIIAVDAPIAVVGIATREPDPGALPAASGKVRREELAVATRAAIAEQPRGRDADALVAWIFAWQQHWPKSFRTTLGADAGEVSAWAAGHAIDANRYLKLRRIALENLARVL